MFFLFVCEFDLPLGTDINNVGLDWSVRGVFTSYSAQLSAMWERMVCRFVYEIDLPLGTDIGNVGVAWSVRDV